MSEILILINTKNFNGKLVLVEDSIILLKNRSNFRMELFDVFNKDLCCEVFKQIQKDLVVMRPLSLSEQYNLEIFDDIIKTILNVIRYIGESYSFNDFCVSCFYSNKLIKNANY